MKFDRFLKNYMINLKFNKNHQDFQTELVRK